MRNVLAGACASARFSDRSSAGRSNLCARSFSSSWCFEQAWRGQRPHTLNPDKLAQSNKKATIEAVGEKKVLTDGTRLIELYNIQNSGRYDGMLIAYLPQEKVLVEADLYTAGPPNAAGPNPVSP
jgi:hypothetical protein